MNNEGRKIQAKLFSSKSVFYAQKAFQRIIPATSLMNVRVKNQKRESFP
jgi:hypothetical protein